MAAPPPCYTLVERPLSGNCWKVRLCLAELQLPYRSLAPEDLGVAEFAALSRRRRVPVLIETARPPLEESAAILMRLAQGTHLLPEQDSDVILSWLIWDQAELSKPLALPRFYARTDRSDHHVEEIAGLQDQAHEGLSFLESWLIEHDWLAGRCFTAADIGVFCYVDLAGEAGIDISHYAAINAWRNRIRARPFWLPLVSDP